MSVLSKILLLFSIPAIWLTWIVMLFLYRKEKHRHLMNSDFPREWESILQKNLPPYKSLTKELRKQLHGYINIFTAEKTFEGCNDLEMTDEIRITIAAQACMLLLNRKTKCYPRLKTVLVYPHTYIAGGKGTFGGQFENESARLGESWNSGVVVLAWNSVKGGALNFHDGHNVTFHEFAHQLDQEDGNADGAPILAKMSCYGSWAKVFNEEYKVLKKKTNRGKKSTMDRYGATNPAEFFAVATETFFEKPKQLSERHPELYEELQSYYHVNPIDWE